MVRIPPAPFTVPVVLCPSCGHGIDPHGVDPGGMCGVREEGVQCECFWSPNDVAFVRMQEARAEEQERVALVLDRRARLSVAGSVSRGVYEEAAAAVRAG